MKVDIYNLTRLQELLDDLYDNLQELKDEMEEQNDSLDFILRLDEELSNIRRIIDLSNDVAFDEEDIDDLFD